MAYPSAPSYPEMLLPDITDASRASAVVAEWAKGQPENLYLEFKRKDDPSSGVASVNDRRAYAKALSGFANSDGGLLVWGVIAKREGNDPESPDVARALDPISGIRAFCADLNGAVLTSTKPVVAGVQNLVIPLSPDADRGFVVTYVPAGLNPPYRAEADNGNRFYKRAGSSFYSMEPYDLRDVVFRFRYPKLDVELSYGREKTDPDEHIYILQLVIANHGPLALREYKLELTLPEACVYSGSSDGTWMMEGPVPDRWTRYVRHSLYPRRTAVPDEFVVYPGERRTILGLHRSHPFRYRVDHSTYSALRQQAKVTCRVLAADMPPVTVEKPFSEMNVF